MPHHPIMTNPLEWIAPLSPSIAHASTRTSIYTAREGRLSWPKDNHPGKAVDNAICLQPMYSFVRSK
jgi:hypothetical protein